MADTEDLGVGATKRQGIRQRGQRKVCALCIVADGPMGFGLPRGNSFGEADSRTVPRFRAGNDWWRATLRPRRREEPHESGSLLLTQIRHWSRNRTYNQSVG